MKKYTKEAIFEALGLESTAKGASCGGEWFATSGETLVVKSPTDGQLLAEIEKAGADDYDKVMTTAQEAFVAWRTLPAPKRGDIVRQLGEALRENKDVLGALVSLENGKIFTEGQGEVQEMIDICDFAVGQSRCLSGPTLQSERPMHRMMEQWHPLGPVGVITAFNFPVAVWAWNCSLAFVCGDPVVWKPSSKAPLCGIACQNIAAAIFRKNGLPRPKAGRGAPRRRVPPGRGRSFRLGPRMDTDRHGLGTSWSSIGLIPEGPLDRRVAVGGPAARESALIRPTRIMAAPPPRPKTSA